MIAPRTSSYSAERFLTSWTFSCRLLISKTHSPSSSRCMCMVYVTPLLIHRKFYRKRKINKGKSLWFPKELICFSIIYWSKESVGGVHPPPPFSRKKGRRNNKGRTLRFGIYLWRNWLKQHTRCFKNSKIFQRKPPEPPFCPSHSKCLNQPVCDIKLIFQKIS